MIAQRSLWSVPTAPERRARPYQVAALEAIDRELAAHRSTAVILLTGGGKTFIAGQAAMRAKGRVLFLAHLDSLVSQAHRELQAITGEPWDLEQGEFRAARKGSSHVVASVQTLMRDMRLRSFDPACFSLVIVDEAHHYVAASFRRPIDYFSSAKILALTATPDRADRKAMGRYIESVAFKMDLVDGINEGWSVPIECRPPVVCDVDLGGIKISKVTGDFDPGALDEAMATEVAPIVRAALDHCGSAPTVIFAPGVKTTHASAEALNRVRPGCATSIDGAMDRTEQRARIAAWKRGEHQYMANCRVLTEGFDYPALAYMIDAAPTTSRALKAQKVGRLLRPLANVDGCATAAERKAAIAASPKPFAVWIDLKCNGDSDALITPADVLGGTFTDQERKAARKQLDKKGGNPLEALLAARARIAARAAKAKVNLKLRTFDPTQKPADHNEVTPMQMAALERMGIAPRQGITNKEAQALIGYEKIAERRGWCNARQRAWLVANVGVSGKGLPVDKGRRLADLYRSIGKLRPTAEQIRAALS